MRDATALAIMVASIAFAMAIVLASITIRESMTNQAAIKAGLVQKRDGWGVTLWQKL